LEHGELEVELCRGPTRRVSSAHSTAEESNREWRYIVILPREGRWVEQSTSEVVMCDQESACGHSTLLEFTICHPNSKVRVVRAKWGRFTV
jgi:hypothetical protein